MSQRAPILPTTGTDVPLNTILYGPPGTGKTYALPVYALSILENRPLAEIEEWPREEVLARFEAFRSQGRLEFVTFHQSYGYEEFIEGIRPVLRDDSPDVQSDAEEETDGPSGEIAYKIEAGIFKAFCEQAEMFDSRRVNVDQLGISDQSSVWKVSLEGTGDNPTRRDCLDNDHIRIGWDQYGENVETNSVTKGKVSLNAFLNRMQANDIVLSCHSKDEIDAIGIVTGEPEWHDEYAHYKRLRKVKWLDKTVTNIRALNGGKKMTLSAVYQLHDITPGIVLDILERNHPEWASHPVEKRNFVFIIDEINRGNISKIFGELITLIETSKRKGAPEAASATLPYSKASFRVPGNVYLLGTMNTADRSIAPIDTALRRRFQFRELLPRPELLEGIGVEGMSVSRMLERMNQRIAALYDREHTIGHSYLLPLRESPDMATLAHIFRENILPLLQEYFFDDFEKIRLVLGDSQKRDGALAPEFVAAISCDAGELFGDGNVACAERRYEIHPEAFDDPAAYRFLL